MKFRSLLALLMVSTWLVGCGKVDVSVAGRNNRTIQARGVTYIVPWETSSHEETATDFSYKGESVSVSESGGKLLVDGKPFGVVKSGDTVSAVAKGVVLVNGSARQAD
jgi:hypothetical protein